MPRGTFPDCCYQYHVPVVSPCRPTPPQETLPTLAGRFGSVPCGVIPLGLGVHKILFVPSKTGVCFPQSCGTPIIKSHWLSRSDLLGIPSPFIRFPRLGSLTWSWESSQQWENFCSNIVLKFCGSPIWRVWDLILRWLCLSSHLSLASFLSLDMGYLFLVGLSIVLSMVVEQLVVILVLLQEEMRTCPSIAPSWTGDPFFLLFLMSPFWSHLSLC